MRIWFEGKLLQDSEVLEDCGLEHYSKVELLDARLGPGETPGNMNDNLNALTNLASTSHWNEYR